MARITSQWLTGKAWQERLSRGHNPVDVRLWLEPVGLASPEWDGWWTTNPMERWVIKATARSGDYQALYLTRADVIKLLLHMEDEDLIDIVGAVMNDLASRVKRKAGKTKDK